MDEFAKARSVSKISTSTLLLVVIGIAVGITAIGGGSYIFFSKQKEVQEEEVIQETPKKALKEFQSNDIIAKIGNENIYMTDLEAYAKYQQKSVDELEDIEKAVNDLVDISILLQAAESQGWIKLDNEFFNSPSKDIPMRGEKVKEIREMFETSGKRGTVVESVALWWWNSRLGQLGVEQGVDIAKSFAREKIENVYDKVMGSGLSMKEAAEILANDSSLAQLDTNYDGNAYTVYINPYVINSIDDVRAGRDFGFEGLYDFIKDAEVGDVSKIYIEKDSLPSVGEIEAYYTFYHFKAKNEGYESIEEMIEGNREGLEIIIYIDL